MLNKSLLHRFGWPALLGCLVLLVVFSLKKRDVTLDNEEKRVESAGKSLKQDSPDQYAKYFDAIRTAEGESGPSYAPGYRLASLEKLRAAAKGGRTIFPWLERGPGNVGGRTRAIIVDSKDATRSTWIAGSVGGGIWRTTNKGLSWTPLTDHLPRLAIGALGQAPSNPAIMYAGTGEGYRNGDALIGEGMFKSTDGGLTWTVLPSTQGSYDFLFVNRLIIDPVNANIVVVATSAGLYRTLNGGTSWTLLHAASTAAGFYQVVHKPGDFSIQYAVEPGQGVWKSIDRGTTWTKSNAGLAEASSNVRLELDVSPANPKRLFAMAENSDAPDKVYISDNEGVTWTLFSDANSINVAGDQGWYDLMVKAHPFDQNVVFLGGVGLYKATITGTTTTSTFNVYQENTSSFLDVVDFGGGHFNGGLRLGTDEPSSTILAEELVPVEIRFGPGNRQLAYRFFPPDQAGVALNSYPYQDYVEVPFEVWDTQNNRQLMVSFRDRNNNGKFDLIERDPANLGREYLFVHARAYSTEPDVQIAQNGGVVTKLAYFLWPILRTGGVWDDANLPDSKLRFVFEDTAAYSGGIASIGAGVHADQHVMIVTPSSGTQFELVLGNDGGVYYSGDGGSTWNERDKGYNTSQFYGVDKQPGKSAYLGGTQDNGSWRSFVNSQPFQFWQSAGSGDGFEAVWHKQNDSKLIATSQWNYISRSLNSGQGFSTATSGMTDITNAENGAQFLTVVEQNPTNSDLLFTVGKSGIWRSDDFAATWTLIPIPEADWGFNGRAKIKVSLKDNNIVWAVAEMDAVPGGNDPNGKLHVSTDQGNNFTAVLTPSISPGRMSGLATSHEDAQTVYVTFAASNRAKIIRSTDLGKTWVDLSGFDPGPDGLISQNGFPDVEVYDVLDFPNSRRLWAATEIGIIESTNDGLSWEIADNGLPSVAVWQLRFLDNQIIAATHGRGIWTLDATQVPSIVSVEPSEAENELPSRLSIGSIYPNPAVSSATMTWSAPVTSSVRIRLVDLQGRTVRVILNGNTTPGEQTTSWQVGDLPAGSYFVQIETTSGTVTRPFVTLK